MTNCVQRFAITAIAVITAGQVSAILQVQVGQSGNPTCGNNTGFAIAVAWGGTPPYSFLWNNNATTDTITGLAPGFYEVTVTDALNATATADVTLTNDPAPYIHYYVSNAGLHGCGTACNSGIRWLPQYAPMNLVQPFSFSVPPVAWNSGQPDELAWVGLCGNTNWEVQLVDDLGCVATLYDFVYENSNPTPMSVLSVAGACSGSSYGSAVVDLGVDNSSPWGPLWQGRILDDAMQAVQSWIGLTCAPGQSVGPVNGLPPGDYFLHRWNFNYTDSCSEYLPFTTPDLGSNCGHLSGNSWYNLDADCVRDFNEVGIPNTVYEVLPGPLYFITNSNGTFDVDLPNGSYTISQLDASLTPGCGMSQPWPVMINSNAVATTWVNTSSEPLDLEVVTSSSAARPGFDKRLYALVRNVSPQLSGPITLTCTFDAQLTFVSASPAASVAGNLVTWNLPALSSFGQDRVELTLNVPIGTALGTVLQSSFTATNTLAESSTANNTALQATTVTGSFDPNDKAVQTSTRASADFYYINQDEWLDYTIRFQNTGTDTAFTVIITDTLDTDLDMSTFEQGAASHSFDVQFMPGRVVKWTFPNILLPDSNTNEPLSHGVVSFRIKPMLPLTPGTGLSNNADIFFDFNPPVRTNDAVVTAEVNTGLAHVMEVDLRIWPNPVDRVLHFSAASTSSIIRAELLSADGRRAVLDVQDLVSRVGADVAHLAAGPYVLLISNADGQRRALRFIKR